MAAVKNGGRLAGGRLRMKTLRHGCVAGAIVVPLLYTAWAVACPFCESDTAPIGYEVDQAAISVLARLTRIPTQEEVEAAPPDRPALAVFQIEEVLKGAEHLDRQQQIEMPYIGKDPVGSLFLINGYEPPETFWSAPLALSPRARQYMKQVMELPAEGPRRYAFFLKYLQDEEKLLADDAYNEFARAPYETVAQLGEYVPRGKVLRWIADRSITAAHRRLYLVLLSTCRQTADAEVLEPLLRSEDPADRAVLDSLIACYLTLRGEAGLPLVEAMYLHNPQAEFADRYAAIRALRFHGQEEMIIPRQRVIEAFRPLVDDPKTAEMVMDDLARWQDWSVLDKLPDLFRREAEDAFWVRVPVARYLLACPAPKAADMLAELEQLDPNAVQHARTMSMPIAATAPPPAPDETGSANKVQSAPPAAADTSAQQPEGPPATSRSGDWMAPAVIGAVVLLAALGVMWFAARQPGGG